jgi:hypothetical protein
MGKIKSRKPETGKQKGKQKQKTSSKLGQAEMFGLVFIVFLIAIALVLVIQSEINRKPTTLKQSFEKSEIATNTINTLIKTRTRDCNRLDIGDLYVDCAKSPESPKIFCETGESSCDYSARATKGILMETLEVWKKKYLLNVSVDGRQIERLSFMSEDFCPLQDRKVESVPLPLNPGTLTIEMWICG